jgi:FMN-dependent NADH-azoreductase
MGATLQPTLLRVDASSRLEGSVSRRLADSAEALWKSAHPQGRVRRRDLAANAVPHVASETIEGFFTPAEKISQRLRSATALSDELIAELKACHTLVISSPMYNFGVPSALKAWIDQVVRVGETFSYAHGEFTGLAVGPRALLVLAYGAPGYSGPTAAMDHVRPFLTTVLNFIGISQVDVVVAHSTTAGAATVAAQIEAAQRSLRGLFS